MSFGLASQDGTFAAENALFPVFPVIYLVYFGLTAK